MFESLDRNKIYIIIGLVALFIFATVFYFTTKNKRIMTHIADLNDRIEELEEVLQKFDNSENVKRNLHQSMNVPSMNVPSMNVPPINVPPINAPPINVPSINTNQYNKPKDAFVYSDKKDPRHVSFNTHVEEIDEPEEITEEDLDAELEDELKELEDETVNEKDETDLKDEE